MLFGETQSIIRHAEAGVINSGTASLETALFGTPQVVGYIINPLTYWLAKKIIKVKYLKCYQNKYIIKYLMIILTKQLVLIFT